MPLKSLLFSLNQIFLTIIVFLFWDLLYFAWLIHIFLLNRILKQFRYFHYIEIIKNILKIKLLDYLNKFFWRNINRNEYNLIKLFPFLMFDLYDIMILAFLNNLLIFLHKFCFRYYKIKVININYLNWCFYSNLFLYFEIYLAFQLISVYNLLLFCIFAHLLLYH